MSYLYAPRFKKVREKAMVLLLFVLSVALFVFSKMPNIPVPAAWQALALVALVISILGLTQSVLKRYTYAVEETDASTDLVVTEHSGKHTRVVCRVSLLDIKELRRLDPNDRRGGSLPRTAGRLYSYVDALEASIVLLLTLSEGEETVYMRIAADETLFSILSTKQKQLMSDIQQ